MKNILILLIGLVTSLATSLTAQNETEIKVDGLLIPRVDRNTVNSPSLGQLIFDTTTDRFWFYDGTQWLEVDNDAQTLSDVLSEGNDAGNIKIINLADPTTNQDAATKIYVDSNDDVDDADSDSTNELNTGLILNSTTLEITDSGGTLTADLSSLQDGTGTDDQNLSEVLSEGNSAGNMRIIDLSDPINPQDATSKQYVDNNDDVDDADNDPTNELDNTDEQDLMLTGNLLEITGDPNTGVDLSPYLDNTDDQNLSEVLTEGNDAGAMAITNLADPTNAQDATTKNYVDTNDDVDDADSDPTNEIELPSGGNSGDVLSTDGMSNYSWIALPSGTVQDELSDADGDTKIQVEESSDEDVIRFDIAGNEVLAISKSSNGHTIFSTTQSAPLYYNLFFGENAGEQTMGDENTFFGQRAGQVNASGSENSFFGSRSGEDNTSGSGNCFFGNDTGKDNISGIHNCFFGRWSGRSNQYGDKNSFYGHNSGWSNTIGDYNVFVGQGCGGKNTEGSDNTFVGANGFENTTGDDNTFVGRAAGVLNTTGYRNSYFGSRSGFNITGNNNVAIGYYAGPPIGSAAVSNRLYIDIQESSDPLIYGEFDNDLVKINGQIHISETLKLEPLSTAPTCDASNEGMMYYNSTNQTLNICKGASGWKEIQTN